MKPGTRPCCEQACNERTRNSEPSQSMCHVDPVGSPECLDERIWIGRRRRDLVVVRDHPFYLGGPVLTPAGNQVIVCERDRWRDVVESAVRPDPEVVEDGSDSYLLELASSHDRDAQIHDPINMVPITYDIVT